jgi:hypothetical protein
MNVLRLFPVVLSMLLLAAHFLRQGLMPVVLLFLLLPALLFFRRTWVARLMQILLVLGALEWIRTMLLLINRRLSIGEPWGRLAIILLIVAAVTGCSAAVFRCGSLKQRYKLANPKTDEPTS